jgi:hypothetical protein
MQDYNTSGREYINATDHIQAATAQFDQRVRAAGDLIGPDTPGGQQLEQEAAERVAATLPQTPPVNS